MHRFVWDLHYPPPDSLNHEIPISAIYKDTPQLPLGAWALPGNYTVKLTADDKSYAQPLVVKMDPRVTSSLAEVAKQFEMQSGSVEGMNESYEMLQQVQSVRAQLKNRMGVSKSLPSSLLDSIRALDKQAAELEGGAQSNFFGVPPSGKQAENLSSLNQHFGATLALADSADAAPTTQATAAYKELESELESLLGRWSKLRKDEIPALNTQLRNANLPAVDPNLLPASKPAADADGDDEP